MGQVQSKIDPMNEAEQRLEDIRSMMDAGQKSIRMEKHTLIYWGITGGLLCTIMPFLLGRFTGYWTTISIFMATITIALATVAVIDYRKTRQIRRQQDRSTSFVQKQITRIWWMLIATTLRTSPPEKAPISLAAYNQQTDQQGTYVVTIPAGSNIPFRVSISGSPIKDVDKHVIPLSLQHPVDIVLIDGKMTDMYRLQGETWQSTRWDYPFRISKVRIQLDKQDGLHALMDMKVLLGKDSND